jgi:hypothetical protein
MERKLVRNNDEFYELCKYWNDIGYNISIFKNNKVQEYPVEYPCMVLIEEVTNTYNDLDYNSALFNYVYKSEFDEIDDEESDDTVRLEDDFFNCDINDYKAIIGKCFRHDNIVLKVLGIRDDFDNKYYEKGHYETEFLYEQYECYNDEWHIQEYIWLQESVYCEYASESYQKEYLRFCLTPNTEMNIGREGMYMLGKDGLLYTDDDGSGEKYNRFEEIPNELFEKIRTEAIENDGVYKVVGTYIDR